MLENNDVEASVVTDSKFSDPLKEEPVGVDTCGKNQIKIDDLGELTKGSKSHNTDKSTRWATSVFEAWRAFCRGNGEDIPPLEKCDVKAHLSRSMNKTNKQTGSTPFSDHRMDSTQENSGLKMLGLEFVDYSSDCGGDIPFESTSRDILESHTVGNVLKSRTGGNVLESGTRQHVLESRTSAGTFKPYSSCDITPANSDAEIELKTTNPKVYECSICQNKYQLRSSLKRHLAVHSTVRLECAVCKKKFFDRTYLNRHMKQHQGVTYKCSVCFKKFMTKYGCELHEKTHRNIFKYYCDQCGKGFNYPGDLEAHTTTHSSEKKYECKKCGKKVKTRGSLARHRSTCGNKTKAVKCVICGIELKQARYLKTHMEKHSGDIECHQCTECGKEYQHSCSLYKHKKRTGHK